MGRPVVTRCRSLTTSRHDPVAQLLGATAQGFEEKNQEIAEQMKRLVLEYVKNVRSSVNYNGAANGSASAPATIDTTVALDMDGFPKLPLSYQKDTYNKKQATTVLKDYLSWNYCE